MEKVKKLIRKIREGFLQKAFFELCWIYKLMRRYSKAICFSTFLALLVTLIGLFLTTLTQGLVDGIVAGEWGKILRAGGIYIGVGAINVACSMISQRFSGVVNAKVRTELSKMTYEKILHADWETIIRHHSGDLMTRMQEDIGTVAGSTVGWIPSVLAQGVQCVLAVCIILYYDFSMLAMVVVVAPIILIGSRIFLGKMYVSNQEQRKISSEIMSSYKESFQHLQSIKSFDLLDFFVDKMGKQQERREKIDLDVNKYSVASWAVMYSSGQLAAAICLGWAVYHVLTGVISIGSMTMLMLLAMNVAGNFKTLIQLIPSAINTIASSERLRSLLELPEEHLENKDAYEEMLADGGEGISLYMNNMNFSYQNGKQVFNQVQCKVEAGEIVAFVGPSGEGKTTMLRILLGIIQAEGDCTLKSAHYELPVSIASRKLMAYVPQGNTMLNGTIAENLRMLKPDATDEEIVTALKEACAWEFVEKLPGGINHSIGESGIGFSEGQNQRLAIARALMCKTPLLLLDEATSALDVATERRVLANLVKGVQKRTCILTTHRPSVLSMCDRVYRIADQKVREIGEEEVVQLQNEF